MLSAAGPSPPCTYIVRSSLLALQLGWPRIPICSRVTACETPDNVPRFPSSPPPQPLTLLTTRLTTAKRPHLEFATSVCLTWVCAICQLALDPNSPVASSSVTTHLEGTLSSPAALRHSGPWTRSLHCRPFCPANKPASLLRAHILLWLLLHFDYSSILICPTSTPRLGPAVLTWAFKLTPPDPSSAIGRFLAFLW
jgi:hypothetical protein